MKNKLKIAIIIPTYSDFIDDTVKAVESVLKSDYENKQIIVVDDGSDKEIQTRLLLIFEKSFTEVILELSSENRGFGSSCNKGAEIAIRNHADVLFFLNNDVVIKDDCINFMVDEFKDEKVAIVGPKIYLGKTNKLNSVGGYFDKKTLLKKEYGCREEDTGQFNERRAVEFVMGSAFMVSAPFFKELGGFDECYFMYAEETDFCYRVIKAGYKIIYQPKAIAWHEHAKTMGTIKIRVMYYQMRNGIYLSRKNGRFSNVFFTITYLFCSHLKTIFKVFLKSIIVFTMAIYDGLKGKMGKKDSRFIN